MIGGAAEGQFQSKLFLIPTLNPKTPILKMRASILYSILLSTLATAAPLLATSATGEITDPAILNARTEIDDPAVLNARHVIHDPTVLNARTELEDPQVLNARTELEDPQVLNA
ncbi:hypothetical protein K491DRAFT_712643 [Lophiostoma macrostomum CBS 122681]|uniref:Uncharacterized protein n=1 Tax=Lophiostoma macrostomum CBS 122681 TaxID=1314788 RepID=A0A6A6TK91_9PLEO|nr:hypothetical protein K491DRAFT_712643 [Lophiostoma macrostomum CBS 122681]